MLNRTFPETMLLSFDIKNITVILVITEHSMKRVKILYTILLVLFSLQTVKAQALIKLRSTLSTCGSSKTFISNGKQYFIQQSIGQSSVIGLSQNDDYLLRQGFIQPLNGSINSTTTETLQASVYPNPFSANITISFAEEISDILSITLYDLNGKTVYFNRYGATQELSINVGFLSPAVYIIGVHTGKECFFSKMVKE